MNEGLPDTYDKFLLTFLLICRRYLREFESSQKVGQEGPWGKTGHLQKSG